MEIEFHPDAVSEIREATRYYQTQQVDLRRRFLSTVEESLTRISNFPESFPVVANNVRQYKTWGQSWPTLPWAKRTAAWKQPEIHNGDPQFSER